MKAAFGFLLVFLLWNVAISLPLLLSSPAVSIPVILLLFGWVIWGYLLNPGAGGIRRRWAALRLRPLEGRQLRWTMVSVPVFLLCIWSLQQVYVTLVPVPPETFAPFQAQMATAMGRLAITLLAVAVAPLIEEFFFRGLILDALERRGGPAWGIFGSAALFALVHALPRVFPLHLFLGLVFGLVVYTTRSIWSGVILHAANNGIAMLGIGIQGVEEPPPTPTVWETGLTTDWWTSLAVLLVAAAAGAWVLRQLWNTHHGARLRDTRAFR